MEQGPGGEVGSQQAEVASEEEVVMRASSTLADILASSCSFVLYNHRTAAFP